MLDLPSRRWSANIPDSEQGGDAVQEKNVSRRFDLGTIKMWRLIQISALLPLTLLGSLMIYFDQVSPFGIVAFFLILIVGVILPQMRGDMILSHFVLSKELEARVVDLEERVVHLGDARAE
jgi:hypothetical protein